MRLGLPPNIDPPRDDAPRRAAAPAPLVVLGKDRHVDFTDRVEAVGGTLRFEGRAGRRTGHLAELPLVAPRS